MIQKIRYRLVYNRRNQLNRQGEALIQIEASLNGRKIYLSTRVYLRPECWSKVGAQVVNHPQSGALNAMLYTNILHLQEIEIDCWKRGKEATLSVLKESVKKHITPGISFVKFCLQVVEHSDRRAGTKGNLRSTLGILRAFRSGLTFSDITYTFLREFDVYLHSRGLKQNTVAKHLRNLRTLVNEAIREGYMSADAYPFNKYTIKYEKREHDFLRPAELKRMENLEPKDEKHRHVLDAFLFCCYTGLRFSDFRQMKTAHILKLRGKSWLLMKSVKTGAKVNIPLYLLFGGKALDVLARYEGVEQLANVGCNADVNQVLHQLTDMAGIKRRITFHIARHTCATLLLHDGVPITTVQKILGHSSVRTTQVYAEVSIPTLVRDLKAVGKAGIYKNNVRNDT